MTQSKMTQSNAASNDYIEKYLDYYCGLPHPPGFAVLLKGKWGCGKTWFINKYLEKFKKDNKKALYVSLYGMTSFAEIEDTFFNQLHPVLSSKEMALAGKILKGCLKATLKIDLDGDKNSDGSIAIQIPEINLPEYLKNTDKSILVFDDLERCQIDIINLLGYINSFVEHQELKVVIVSNEEEIQNINELKKNNQYDRIKEKLIGQTLDVCFDIDNALKYFINEIKNKELKTFLSKNIDCIKEIYDEAESKNLRILKHIILDFERIFEELPKKVQKNADLLQELLRLTIIFSIEIKEGNLKPKQITKFEEAYISGRVEQVNHNTSVSKQNNSGETSNNSSNDNNEELAKLKTILNRYKNNFNLLIYELIPSWLWWENFFDKGLIESQELKDLLLNNKYFQDENTPNWVKLWHFYDSDMNDDEFNDLLKDVESDYDNRKFICIEEVQHITGIFLKLSDLQLWSKDKQYLLEEAKKYIDYLISEDKLDLSPTPKNISWSLKSMTGYRGLSYHGRELEEFNEFCGYFDQVKKDAIAANMPKLGSKLLDIMQSDTEKYSRMICSINTSNPNDLPQVYYRIPIFRYIEIEKFMSKFMSLNLRDKQTCLLGFTKRYKYDSYNKELLEELDFLKLVRSNLLNEASNSKSKLGGYHLKLINDEFLEKAIKNLEKSQNKK